MTETKHWLESESPDITVKSFIDEKNSALMGFGERVYKRRNDWEALDLSMSTFQSTLNGHIGKIDEEYKKFTSKQATALTEENFNELKGIVQNYNDTLNNAVEKLGKALKYIDPPVSYEAMNRHIKEFNDVSIIISFNLFILFRK